MAGSGTSLRRLVDAGRQQRGSKASGYHALQRKERQEGELLQVWEKRQRTVGAMDAKCAALQLDHDGTRRADAGSGAPLSHALPIWL